MAMNWDWHATWFGTPIEKPMPVNEFIVEMRNCLRRTDTIVRNWLHCTSDWIKTCYKIRANSLGFSIGDHVWLYNPACKKRCGSKLQQDGDELYVIIKSLNDVVYQIQKSGGRFKVVHVYRLTPWNCDHSLHHELKSENMPLVATKSTNC